MVNAFNVGDQIGGFAVVEQVVGGAFSETWRCVNQINGRQALLKGIKSELLDSADEVITHLDLNTRTKEEAKILSALVDKKYSFVPDIYDVFQAADGRVFFISQFVKGKLLSNVIQDELVTLGQRAKIAFQLVSALAKIHDSGIVHRDIAPDNIMVQSDFEVVLLDFGLAKIKSELLVRKYSPQTVTPLTKIKYMPPRAFKEWKPGQFLESNESWDLYAAGVVIYELLTDQILPGPTVEISTTEIEKTICPETISELLSHAYAENRGSAATIEKTLFRELAHADLLSEIREFNTRELARLLEEENNQLRIELAKGKQRVTFEDFVQYVSRSGVKFQVDPTNEYIELLVPTKTGSTQLVIRVREKFVVFEMPFLRAKKTPKLKILEFLNEQNGHQALGRFTFDPDDGEIRYSIGTPYHEEQLSYDTFKTLLGLTYAVGSEFLNEFDESFN